MQQVEYQVVHSIPGRIRIHIPRLKNDLEYRVKLQGLIESLEFVEQVSVDPAAASIVVKYQELLPQSQLQQKLVVAIEQAANSDLSALTRVVSFAGYESVSLTPYEFAQVIQIKQWWEKEPEFLSNLTSKVFHPLKVAADALISTAAIDKIQNLCNKVTSQWQKDWEKIKSSANVDDYHAMKHAQLEVCDRLAQKVESSALNQASVEGSVAGFYELAGEVADVGLITVLALQIVHRTGLCYGYSPETATEQQFSWAILGVATANTTEERSSALEVLQNLHCRLYEQTCRDVIDDSITGTVEESAIESTITQVIASIASDSSGEAVPILGIGFGIVSDRSIIARVSTSARSAFQLRWLLENKKMRFSQIFN